MDLGLVSISLSNYCNKQCSYCISASPFKKELILTKKEEEKIYSEYPYIHKKLTENNIKIGLIGGEPGILPDHILDFILSFSCYSVFTNGTIFNKPSMVKYKNNVEKFFYHISPEIKEDMYVEEIKDFSEIEYIVVVHKLNISILKKFLLNNLHLNFSILLNSNNNFNKISYLKARLNNNDLEKIKEIVSNVPNVENKDDVLDRSSNDMENISTSNIKKCFKFNDCSINVLDKQIYWCNEFCAFRKPTTLSHNNIDLMIEKMKCKEEDYKKYCLKCDTYKKMVLMY